MRLLLTALLTLGAPAALPAGLGAAEIRLVTLAPHLTELVYQVGAEDLLVGVVEWSNHPPEARELPRIGDAFRFDMERIVQSGASHALVWEGGTPEAAVRQVRALGLEVLMIRTRSLDDIGEALEAIGRFTARADAGRAAAESYRNHLGAMRRKAGSREPVTVFYQVSERPLYTLAGRHVINEVFGLCDAENLFSGLDVEAAVVELESVLAANPDVILAGEVPGADDPLSGWRGRTELEAVRCERYRLVDAELLVRPTPRVLEGATRLCRWLEDFRRDEDPACRIGSSAR